MWHVVLLDFSPDAHIFYLKIGIAIHLFKGDAIFVLQKWMSFRDTDVQLFFQAGKGVQIRRYFLFLHKHEIIGVFTQPFQ